MTEIARLAHVAPSTVSRSLRDDPAIPLVRRTEIKRIAKELGYQPNPLVSTLMAQVHRGRRADDPDHIAWIDLWPPGTSTPAVFMSEILGGARQRARALGYDLEVHKAGELSLSADRVRQILLSRSQWGFIIPPVPEHAMNFPLLMTDLAGVTIGTSLVSPALHRVTTNHFLSAQLAWDALHAKGFKRIGLALSPRMNSRLNGQWLGGYLAEPWRLGVEAPIPPLLVSASDESKFFAWFRDHQPDAILLAEPLISAWAERCEANGSRPAIAWLALESKQSNVWGLDYRAEHIGAAAVDMVVAQIHRNERGSPAHPHTLLLDAVWTER